MGSGKSTHGRKLAKALGAEFIDLDSYVSKKTGKTVTEIFNEFGEDFFRDQETLALKEIINIKQEPCIISLGGGAVCFNNNLELILKNGLLIYLQTHENVLRQRLLRSSNKRPLISNMSEDELLRFIRSKVQEREKFYNKAQLRINGVNLNTAILIKAIEEYYA